MVYVLAGAVAGWAVTAAVLCIVFARLLGSQQRAHARREDLLTNQLLHAAGRAWMPAPADAQSEATVDRSAWVTSPEQQPL